IIDAKKWSYSPSDLDIIKKGNVIRVDGTVKSFKDNLQISIDGAFIASKDDPNFEDVVAVSPINFDTLKSDLDRCINLVSDSDYHNLLIALFNNEDIMERYLNFPAAVRNHHDFLHGILHHSLSMVHLIESIVLNYNDLNKDLLICGALLHDIGKIVELSGPVGTVYTKEGLLLGHLLIGVEIVSKVGEEIKMDKEKLLLLKHLIASHHGKLEFGAIALPQTREAFILASVDDFDAKMMAIDKALANTEKDSFSERIFALENRSFLK
ncbi:MAG: HD domain-containing protein, partial [Candidatus Onthovivens sp.]|nr:HD domain-containing protein [Candidatus Onthovivens sp.]